MRERDHLEGYYGHVLSCFIVVVPARAGRNVYVY